MSLTCENPHQVVPILPAARWPPVVSLRTDKFPVAAEGDAGILFLNVEENIRWAGRIGSHALRLQMVDQDILEDHIGILTRLTMRIHRVKDNPPGFMIHNVSI
jgi:hypothetical protein